jgi:hypothetical protein
MKTYLKSGIALLLVAISLSSCNFFKHKDSLCASWKLMGSDDREPDNLLQKEFYYAHLRFYDNNEYTFLNGDRFAHGKWAFDKKDSTLTIFGFKHNANLVLKVKVADGDWLKGHTTFMQTDMDFLFKQDPYFEHNDMDLLSQKSNAWRIKPDHKESKEEIRERVTAHIEYMRQYFGMVHQEKRASFQTGFMHTPLNFYQNGIGLKRDLDLPPGWIDSFYDVEDALAGSKLIGQSIESITSYPESTGSYTEGYYKALQEMKTYLVMLK